MIKEEAKRTAELLGNEGVLRLSNAHIAVFGIGGVGSFAVEALARAGVGTLTLIDSDTVSLSNINRQLPALHSTVGMKKTEVMKMRITDINPDCKVYISECFYLPETKDCFDFKKFDYVLDCIDTVTGKISLIEETKKAGTPIISAMGAGNKLDPTLFRVSDIEKTSVCPLAKVMRRELKKRGIKGVKAVYSVEEPVINENAPKERQKPPGSVSFVPSVMGLIMAGEVIKEIVKT